MLNCGIALATACSVSQDSNFNGSEVYRSIALAMDIKTATPECIAGLEQQRQDLRDVIDSHMMNHADHAMASSTLRYSSQLIRNRFPWEYSGLKCREPLNFKLKCSSQALSIACLGLLRMFANTSDFSVMSIVLNWIGHQSFHTLLHGQKICLSPTSAHAMSCAHQSEWKSSSVRSELVVVVPILWQRDPILNQFSVVIHRPPSLS